MYDYLSLLDISCRGTMKKYDDIVSLGFFCGIAQEVERIGLRNCSYPLDWVISDFQSVLELLQNNFEDFLNINYLEKDTSENEQKDTYVVINKKYNIKFFHDFKKEYSIEEQLKDVEQKYKRRINRLYKNICNYSTLFIRYIKNEEEYQLINSNFDKINSILKSFNKENDIIYVYNDDLSDVSLPRENFYKVKKDKNDKVNRKCLKSNKKLKRYILKNVKYNKKKRTLQRYKYMIKSIKNRIKNKLSTILLHK